MAEIKDERGMIMNLFYGLEIPLMGLSLLIWILFAWIAGRLPWVSERRAYKNYLRVLKVFSIVLTGITVLIFLVALLKLDYVFVEDKVWLTLMLLLMPLLAMLIFSLTHIRRMNASVKSSLTHEDHDKIRRMTTSVRFVLPIQFGVHATIMALGFILFPHGFLSFMDYLAPCGLLIVLLGLLWFRYSRRERLMKRSLLTKNYSSYRFFGTTISLLLIVGNLAAFLSIAILLTFSDGDPEVFQNGSVDVQSGYVFTEGDELYYEVRGKGPALLMISGGGGDAGFYTYVAEILAEEYQVITYDRRGNSRSTWNAPRNFEVSQQARDAVAVLRATGNDSAHVFGNSGGAVFALEMADQFPEFVDTVVLHEPPVVKVLPDREKWLSFFSSINLAAHRFGVEAANTLFTFSISVPVSAFKHIPEDFQERNTGNSEILVTHEMQPSIHYNPNVEKIKQNEVKVVMAAGELSLTKGNYYARTAPILADQLNAEFVEFPGHHLSYFDEPEEWAETLRRTLQK